MTPRARTLVALVAMALIGIAFNAVAKDIPAQLPVPDGKPGDATKPVKVYILAGQSNMVGMGDIGGARNLYNGVYLTPDPAAPKGPMQIYRVGNYVNAGEGFALYLNGKLLAESKVGVFSRQGGQPRGSHIYADFRGEFKDGKVTIAATSFLRYNNRSGVIPPRGHLTLWIEEQKIPPVEEVVAGDQ